MLSLISTLYNISIHEKNFTIPIPKDSEGYTQRECPSCQDGRFGIVVKEDAARLICPYCEHEASTPESNTKEQIDYATKQGINLIETEVHKEFQKMLKNVTRGSKGMSFKPGRIPKKRATKPPQPLIQTDMQCSSCANEYVVYGIAANCPFCGNKDIRLLDANLDAIQKEMDNNRVLRHIYNDLVIVFQNECQYYAGKVKGVSFQNIDSAVKHMKNKHSFDLLKGISVTQEKSLRTAFQKRHTEQHNRGYIDQEYIDNLNEDKSLLGSKTSYSKDELSKALEALVVVSANIRKNIHPATS